MARDLITIRDYIRWGASRLNASGVFFGHGTDNAIDEAAALVLHVLHLGPELLPGFAECRVTDEESERIEALLNRRLEERVPTPYLTGEAWFAGMRFRVGPDVLIPRSSIAELIESGFQPWVDGFESPLNVLDLCTGSGCIAIATAAHLPAARIDAVDLSKDALSVAADNVADHGLGDRVRLIRSDLFEALDDRRYHLIVSNPPYVGEDEIAGLPAEYAHEPNMALASGMQGLEIPLRILKNAPDHLEPGGVLIMEVGNSEAALVAALPHAPFLWLEFERGGHGVLLLESEQLRAMQEDIAALLSNRGCSSVE